ncbi:hypothetical protein O6H91_Y317700 [Diphasiastrum complanatum]|nr:hypothetical protein O6H91_Y317700 [Diphasiastrum complanatum]
MPLRDVVSWNTLILGFVKCGHGEKALELFERMQQEKVKPNAVTFVAVLNACTSIGALERGKLVHSQVIECGLDSDGFVGNNLIDMYAKCGIMEEAWKVFVNMPECDVVGWSSLIGGYVGCGMAQKALQIFQQMQEQKVKPNGVTFLAVLNACACLAALDEGWYIHAETIKHEMESVSYVQNCLIDMYAKCGSMEDACQVFNIMPSRDVVSWNNMIFGYVNSGEGEKAIELFRQMQQEEVDPDSGTIVGALNACGSIAALEDGKLVHSYVVLHGLQSNVFVLNCLIDMYAKCGSIDDAFNIFEDMPTRDTVSWSAMILGYVRCGKAQKALELFRQMQDEQVEPNSVTFIGTLKACSSISALEDARILHAQIIRSGLQADVHVMNCLLDMYSKCGSIEDAWRVFNELPSQDLVSWNSMIVGYSKCGQERKALDLFLQMQQEGVAPNNLTFIGALSACANIGALEDGKLLHGRVIQCGLESDIIVANSLIDMYAKSGSIESAFRVFNTMHAHDVVSWSTMIAGFAKCRRMEMVWELYGQMQQEDVQPNCITFVGMLNACSNMLALEEGKLVHAQIVRMGMETDTFVGNCLVDMYAKCGNTDDAHRVFSSMPIRDVVLWNTMIMGYIKCGKEKRALDLFKQMQEQGMEPNRITFAEVINACASIAALDEGKSIHAQLLRKRLEMDPFISNSLINMYACCVSTEAACRVFHNMSERDVVSWNTMIMGHVKCENGEKALELFWHMQQGLVQPNSVTFVAALNACASVAALNEGKLVHAKAIRSGLDADSFVGNCLVDMYAKCGSIEDACRVFNNMAARDTVSWNTMLVSYGMHGLGRKSFKLFDLMSQEGAEMENCTFVSLLSAFSHVGLVDEGVHCFESMGPIHGIQPTVEHYSCMVDILGRSSELDEAENLIKTMRCESNVSVWMSLLGACRTHGNLQMGERAAKEVLKLDPGNSSGYVLLSHIYAANGCWDSSLKIQHMRKNRHVHKKPGCTWIEVDNQVHRFVADDKQHPQIEDIWAKLNQLHTQMKEAGYLPNPQFISHDVNVEPRVMSLYRHSERLAIAFGLISTPLGYPIRIMKNLRVCEDCHTATKFISKIVGRSIIVRDSSRFHHFDNGLCSCNNYW